MRKILLGIAAFMLVSISVPAQELKPVKDKTTKLYGYQDKQKNWVIEPSFEKAKKFSDGFAIVENGGKKGLINTTGKWIMAADCSSITVSVKEGVILAKREVDPEETGQSQLWGVYDLEGGEVFEPQFTQSPSFRNGRSIERLAANKLYGVISSAGEELLPFEYLAISSYTGGYYAMDTDFVVRTFDTRGEKVAEFAHPGAVRPYDAGDDPVRLAAWNSGFCARRMHRNDLRLLEITRDRVGQHANCYILDIDWGYNRFVRFEPERVSESVPGAFPEPNTGAFYTVKAILYEADGTLVAPLTDYGWFEATCEEGIVYNAGGQGMWLLMKDINTPAIPTFSTPLSRYYAVDRRDAASALDISSYEIKRYVTAPYRAIDRRIDIIEGENAGITTYLPRPAPDIRAIRALEDIMRAPAFRREYHIGEVVSCSVQKEDDKVRVKLAPKLICHFEDRFRDPSYSITGIKEEIWWGPGNARFVVMSLEPVGRGTPGIEDDIHQGGDLRYAIVLSMYDENGRYLRTLLEAPEASYVEDGIIVFERAGIAIVNPEICRDGEVLLSPAAPAKLSTLRNFEFHPRKKHSDKPQDSRPSGPSSTRPIRTETRR